MVKKKYFIVYFIFIAFSILSAQPYYYTSTYKPFPYGHHHTGDIYRINMYNPAEVESLMTNIYDLGSPITDENGNWIVYEEYLRLTIMNLNNPNQKNVISEYCEGVIMLSYAEDVNKLVILYLGDYPNPYKLVLVDPSTLTITDTIPYDIRWECSTKEDIVFSQNGDVMYLLKTDTVQQKGYIASYSLSSKQIVSTKYIEELSETGEDEFFFSFRKNGLSVIESLFLLPTPTSYYKIYFLDKDSLSIPIIRDNSQTWADGYVTSEGDYLLLFNNLLNSDSLGFTYTGKIEIYDMTNGELKKTIQLPSGGEVMCFENYPNNVYYAIDIEEPSRQIYTLKMDSIFNVLDLTSLNPSSAMVNSPPFTLTVNGYGFDTLSSVYFNEVGKATTYISDSVLTAEIDSSDISVVGNYAVWVTDQWDTSDTLYFSVLHAPPILNVISPGISFLYASEISTPLFTGTATGEFFTDSSTVYFNGVPLPTANISDSIITFEVYSDQITTTGNYPVWVSNYGSNSDTLIFLIVDNLPQSITPTLQCVKDNGGGSYTAYFGYINNNSADVYIPAGTKNKFTPNPQDRGQSRLFLPGTHSNAFSIIFDGDDLTWILDGTKVKVNKKSTPCP